MTDKLKKLFEDTKHESLSDYERSVMREHLKLFIAEHPARASFGIRIAGKIRETLVVFQTVSLMRLHPVALSLVLVLCVGVGTSYAAEGTVPGDTLYPVKVNVNEQVQGALARSPQAKADWNARRATRRLEEAEVLASEGRLTAALRVDLQRRFEETADDFDANVLSLASATGSPRIVATTASNLEASLQERADAFAQIASLSSTSKDEMAAFRGRIDKRSKRIQRVRMVANRFIESSGENVRKLSEAAVGEQKEGQGSTQGAPVRGAALAEPARSEAKQFDLDVQKAQKEDIENFQEAIRKAQSDDSDDDEKDESEQEHVKEK